MTQASKIVFKEDDLTIGDLEDFEDIAGKPLDEALGTVNGKSSRIDAKTLKAIVFIIKRRENPAFTIEDARSVTVGELVIDLRPNPSAAAKTGPKKPSTKKPAKKR